MRALVIFLVALGMTGAAIYLVAARLSQMPVRQEAGSPLPAQDGKPGVPVQARPSPEAKDPAAEPEPIPARQVASGTIVAPSAASLPLQREAPRKPLGALGQAKEPEPVDPSAMTKKLLHKPVVTAAGRLSAGGYDIVLSGIRVTDPATTCTSPDGSANPCGMRARTAFRRFVRGRAVECLVPEKSTGGEISTSCTLGGTDLATWLAEMGWAAADGPPLASRAEKAKKNGLGLHDLPPAALPPDGLADTAGTPDAGLPDASLSTPDN